jgi:hypothetical protein
MDLLIDGLPSKIIFNLIPGIPFIYKTLQFFTRIRIKFCFVPAGLYPILHFCIYQNIVSKETVPEARLTLRAGTI